MKLVPYVEVIGVPGVGKTTLYKKLVKPNSLKRHDVKEKLVSLEETLHRSTSIPKTKHHIFKHWPLYLLLEFSFIKHRRILDKINSIDEDALKDFISDFPELIQFSRQALNLRQDHRSEYEKAIGYSRFLRQVIAYSMAQRSLKEGEILIADQFINHSVFRILPMLRDDQIMESLMKDFFQKTPRALILLLISDKVENIVEKIINREKVALQHNGKSISEIRDWTEIAQKSILKSMDYVKDRGTIVLEVNASSYQAEEVITYISQSLYSLRV